MAAPAISIDNPADFFQNPRFRADPYPAYAALRAAKPVFWLDVVRGFVLTRYEDVAVVLRDARFSVDRTSFRLDMPRPGAGRRARQAFEESRRHNLLFMDPPDHTRLRASVARSFTPRRVQALRPRIQRISDELIDAARERGRFDLIRDFAYPLPVTVIAELLGLPLTQLDDLKRWSDDFGVVLLEPHLTREGTEFEGAEQSFLELADFLRDVFRSKRARPGDDLLSALLGSELSEPEILSIVSLLLVAGHETTTNLIGNAVLALLRNPDQRRRLEQEPELMSQAIEEFLRYDSPVQLSRRVASEDCEVGGQKIRRGERLYLVLGAANRDPGQFEDPDRLDLGRRDARHLAFGGGIHACLGAPLARAEAAIAIDTLLRRLPGFEAEPGEPCWRSLMVLRGLASLPLVVPEEH
ncbi:MAG: cytochrome P450 [Myxococcota bacterium]